LYSSSLEKWRQHKEALTTYSGTPLIWTPMGEKKVSICSVVPYFRG
jgi:hypothetical protein